MKAFFIKIQVVLLVVSLIMIVCGRAFSPHVVHVGLVVLIFSSFCLFMFNIVSKKRVDMDYTKEKRTLGMFVVGDSSTFWITDLNDQAQLISLKGLRGEYTVTALVRKYGVTEEMESISCCGIGGEQRGDIQKYELISESGLFCLGDSQLIPVISWPEIGAKVQKANLIFSNAVIAVKLSDGAGTVPLHISRNNTGMVSAVVIQFIVDSDELP